MICSYCNHKIRKGSKFCENCGKAVIDTDNKKITKVKEKIQKEEVNKTEKNSFSPLKITGIIACVLMIIGNFLPHAITESGTSITLLSNSTMIFGIFILVFELLILSCIFFNKSKIAIIFVIILSIIEAGARFMIMINEKENLNFGTGGYLFAVGLVIVFFSTIIMAIKGPKNNYEKIKEKNYELTWGKKIGFYILSIISSELLLMTLVKLEIIEEFYDEEALMLVIIVSIPIVYLYCRLYNRYTMKKKKLKELEYENKE